MTRQFNQQTVAELEQAGSFCDTLMACAKAREQGKTEWTRHYLSGDYPPHYPVPAIYTMTGTPSIWDTPEYSFDIK